MKDADRKGKAAVRLAGALWLALPTAGFAAPPPAVEDAAMAKTLNQRAADAVSAMKGRKSVDQVFTSAFVAAVPPEKLRELARQLTAQNGEIRGHDGLVVTAPWSARFAIQLDRAVAQATLQLEAQPPHRIAGLRITSVEPRDDGLAAITADFRALPGASGFAVTRLDDAGPVELAAQNAGQRFAIGSAFKLWVLDALARDIASGKRKWADVVPLGPPSLPSGIMQDWPSGSPVTLETLATAMISLSDNTATDTLIRLLGREAVEAQLAATGVSDSGGMTPFLTTLEAFTLKSASDADKAAWAAADSGGRRAILAALGAKVDARTIDWSRLETGSPNAIDSIEWFATPQDVARVLDSLRRKNDARVLAVLSVAPMLPDTRRSKFDYVGYKGGSEVGVIALNWLIRSKSGQYYAVVATWNDPARKVDDARFVQLAQRLTSLVE